MKHISFIIAIGFLLSATWLLSCNKEETLTPSDLTEKYIMVPGTNAADTFRYNFFNKYQNKFLFDFDKKDYWYAMNSTSSSNDSIDKFLKIADTSRQRRAMEFLNAQWLLFYPAQVKQDILPQFLFIVDRVWDYPSSSTTQTPDSIKYFKTNSFNNITIAGLGNRFDTMSVATKTKLRNDIHFGFLYNWIYLRNKSYFPQEFYDVSSAKYNLSPRDSISTVYNDYLKNGFLPPVASQYPGSNASFSTARYQNQDEDISQYLRMIVQQNDTFINTTINNPNAAKVKQKYQILLSHFTKLGINVRTINTTPITKLGPLDVY